MQLQRAVLSWATLLRTETHQTPVIERTPSLSIARSSRRRLVRTRGYGGLRASGGLRDGAVRARSLRRGQGRGRRRPILREARYHLSRAWSMVRGADIV